MVKYTVEEVLRVMKLQERVRNISVIAHVDHGKTTLTDSLVYAAGLISKEAVGKKRFTDNMAKEIEKGITIKSTSVSLLYNFTLPALYQATPATTSSNAEQETSVLVNLIDSPGHVDFSSEVTAALRVTDGALVVVDVVEGCRTQTETVLRQALQERIKPVLMINKIDRGIVELQHEPEELYQQLRNVIENTNGIISTYIDEHLGSIELNPSKGNVAFGSGKLGWAFTLTRFAEMYAKKFGIPAKKLMKRFWGEHYYDHETKKWSTSALSASGKKLKRSFCEFVLEPIYKFFSIIKEKGGIEDLEKITNMIGIKLTEEERQREIHDSVKFAMQKFIPAHEALLEMIVAHLPSPVQAQAYRYPLLYTGPIDDKYANSIKKCDPNGPLMMFVSKMVPSSEGGRFIAFGRVFSGTVKQGEKVRIMGPAYDSSSNSDVYSGVIQRSLLMMGGIADSLSECPAGNVCGLVGVDKYIVKTATLTEESCKDAHPLKSMKYSVSPVVQIAVEPENPADLKKLIEGLKKLVKYDGLIQCTTSSSGEHIIAGAGELHLEMCLSTLEDEYCKGVKIRKSNPVVSFCETIIAKSEPVLTKSANKLNRLYFDAEPLSEELTKAIESEMISAKQDEKLRGKMLVEQYSWDANAARKIWCFGPNEQNGPNIVVDGTKGVDVNDIKDSVASAFQWASKQGILTEEPMRGIRFNLIDAKLHSDSVHRGADQIMPAARRAFYGAQLSAKPRIVEPIYIVEIATSQHVVGSVYNVINKKRGTIIGTETTPGTPLVTVKAYLPVLESFGLTETLRGSTRGQAFPQCSFDHWQVLETQDPYETSTRAYEIVKNIRARKGLKSELPSINDFVDKL